MNRGNSATFPLRQLHIELLQTALDRESSSDLDLALALIKSPATIHTYWGEILDALDVHSRAEAIARAVNHRIVSPRWLSVNR